MIPLLDMEVVIALGKAVLKCTKQYKTVSRTMFWFCNEIIKGRICLSR